MKTKICVLFSTLFFSIPGFGAGGCDDPSGVYAYKDDLILEIATDFNFKVVDSKDRTIVLFEGKIINFDEYRNSIYHDFVNPPDTITKNKNLGDNSTLHISKDFSGIKMGWKSKSKSYNYYFVKDI